MRTGWSAVSGALVLTIALLACGAERGAESAAGANGTLTVSIAPGERWRRGAPEAAGEVGPVGDAEPGEEAPGEGPQVAVWLEDPAGGFVSTVFVTRRAAVEDWGGVPGADGPVAPRPLPVWAVAHRGVGVEPMASCGACHGKRRSDDKGTAGDPILEAITGSSPAEGVTRRWLVPEQIEPGAYEIRVEVNHWLDPNDRYPAAMPAGESNAGGGSAGPGQPSLVWAGTVEIGPDPQEGGLTLIGHGHPSGANGEVGPELAGLTTALSIVDTIHMAYAPPAE